MQSSKQRSADLHVLILSASLAQPSLKSVPASLERCTSQVFVKRIDIVKAGTCLAADCKNIVDRGKGAAGRQGQLAESYLAASIGTAQRLRP